MEKNYNLIRTKTSKQEAQMKPIGWVAKSKMPGLVMDLAELRQALETRKSSEKLATKV